MLNYYSNHLSGIYRYWRNGNTSFKNIKDIIESFKSKTLRIDSVSVLSILMKNYIIGNRTQISDIKILPWMSKIEKGNLELLPLPVHSNIKLSFVEISKKLKYLMKKEALAFVKDKKTIAILLSGGMDSRIVAGIIRELQLSGEFKGEVIGLTWGVDNSRDVIYSKQITEKFGWEYNHFKLDAEILKENIILAAERGAEYSPVHLHAMKKISELNGIDGILAGSYGDSIGRGEYSGRKIDEIPDILENHFNHFSFMLNSAEKDSLIKLKKDLRESREMFPARSEMEYREIEMQMHYMRRQLNACMNIIDEKIPLYQMFTSPDVFGFMWSLSRECRSDDVYEYLLNELSEDLLDIPWARTGKKYNSKNTQIEDQYLKLYNRYGDWLRNDNREFIIEKILNGNLQKMGIFNNKSLKMWTKIWPKDTSAKANRVDEKMAWLASLSIFIENNNIQPVQKTYKSSILDNYNIIKAYLYNIVYHFLLKILKK